MESLGYLLIYFFRGRLPWQGLKTETQQQKYKAVIEKKTNINLKKLYNKQLREIAVYINYIRFLKFKDKSNYLYLRKIF
jgi:hypothetical protein